MLQCDRAFTQRDLLGAYHGFFAHMDLPAGYLFPLSRSRDRNSGLTAGLIWHF